MQHLLVNGIQPYALLKIAESICYSILLKNLTKNLLESQFAYPNHPQSLAYCENFQSGTKYIFDEIRPTK
jgi:hypothetical protein